MAETLIKIANTLMQARPPPGNAPKCQLFSDACKPALIT